MRTEQNLKIYGGKVHGLKSGGAACGEDRRGLAKPTSFTRDPITCGRAACKKVAAHHDKENLMDLDEDNRCASCLGDPDEHCASCQECHCICDDRRLDED